MHFISAVVILLIRQIVKDSLILFCKQMLRYHNKMNLFLLNCVSFCSFSILHVNMHINCISRASFLPFIPAEHKGKLIPGHREIRNR